MIGESLSTAGFAGIEEAGGVVHARLPSSGAEFRAEPDGALWRLTLVWPMRAPEDGLRAWNRRHPEAPVEIWQGETQLSMRVSGTVPEVTRWGALAEEAVAQFLRWRREQRAPGEGM
ncbi:hypothetical protein [Pseudogemmobacter sonorensis]|uniref:hypothetical protein n=1 Tax=Pseudogemmobacter sonorensis TaxID=2989681 RepID=UPI00369B079F